MFRLAAIASVAVSLVTATSAIAEDAAKPGASAPVRRDELNKLIHDYLIQHPDVLNEVMAALQAKEKSEKEAAQKQSIVAHRKELLTSPEGTVIGNPKGDVTVVEFFDYNCGYCKSVFPALLDTVKTDGKVHLVLKEFPILAPSSETASRAALASVKQGKYSDFHIALMRYKGSLDDETIMQIAKDIGLNVVRLQADMKAPEINTIIARNQQLAREMGVEGTPTVIIGDSIAPNGFGQVALKEMITKARAKS